MDLFEDSPANKVNAQELSSNGKVVMFGVPGAFTPGCSKTHLPGYIEKAEQMKSEGVKEIVCVAVNDPYVMAAWGKDHNAKGKVRLVSRISSLFLKPFFFQHTGTAVPYKALLKHQ